MCLFLELISYHYTCLCSSVQLVDTVFKAVVSGQVNGFDSFIVCHCHISSVRDEQLQNLQLCRRGGNMGGKKRGRKKGGINLVVRWEQ